MKHPQAKKGRPRVEIKKKQPGRVLGCRVSELVFDAIKARSIPMIKQIEKEELSKLKL